MGMVSPMQIATPPLGIVILTVAGWMFKRYFYDEDDDRAPPNQNPGADDNKAPPNQSTGADDKIVSPAPPNPFVVVVINNVPSCGGGD
ncbi:hypothetical protein F0562_022321 [Nyssa sinensis]|uniref:Uncharacterized protein n=1 Tax=Nyssa sinensis TaxID=561372 RepID=A0A5J5BN77_9ASTE|nr:hypothetical protein F0562_022321 [Nyssa sinensis]